MNFKIIAYISILFILASCTKSGNHPVPYQQFDIDININLPSYSDLLGVGGWAYANGGVKGIVIYRRSADEFVAFDRMATTDNAIDCATGLETDDDNFLILNDPCSDAQYSLFDGSIIAGGVEFGLRQYQTAYNGSYTLRIFNQ